MTDSEQTVEYAVEVLHGRTWRVRYGWFPNVERARFNFPYALNEGYEEVRIVKRTIVQEIVT